MRTFSPFRCLLFLFGTTTALACGSDSEANFDAPIQLLPYSLALNERLLLVDEMGATAHLVDTSEQALPTLHISLAPHPSFIAARNGSQTRDQPEALILSAGQVGNSNRVESSSSLTLVSAVGEVSKFSFGNNSFDVAHQSPNGRYAVLRRSTASERLLRNVNEIAIVDLDAGGDDAKPPEYITLTEPPRGVSFSSDFTLGDIERQLAVVLTSNTVTLVDLQFPNRTPTSVVLSTDLDRSVIPEQVVFDSNNARLYVRGTGADDIFSIKLNLRENAEEGRNDFSVAIDIIAAGRQPSDMQLFDNGGQTWLLVMAPGNRTAVAVDVRTSRTISTPLPVSFEHALVFNDPDSPTTPHALLWGDNRLELARLTLDVSEDSRERLVEMLPTLVDSVATTRSLPDGRMAVITGSSGMSVVDPVGRTVTPYAASRQLENGYLDIGRSRLWVAPRYQNSVAYVDMIDGSTDEFELDNAIELVAPMFSQGKLAVVHNDPLGHISLIEVENAGRRTSRSIQGFLLEGLLDQ